MTLELFTVKDYDRGDRPERIRNGTRIKDFHYFAGATFCFVGVDVMGITHLWRANGRKNGKVNNMPTDLVREVMNPNTEIMFLARTSAGNFYAGNDLDKVKAGLTKATEFTVYRFEIDFKKETVIEWENLETVKVPKK
jgi:hypothetical protein